MVSRDWVVKGTACGDATSDVMTGSLTGDTVGILGLGGKAIWNSCGATPVPLI